MLGMLNLRKIQTLKKHINKLIKSNEIDYYSLEDLLQKWLLSAKSSFETSIEINPASPYGFTAQCQLFSECLKTARILKKSKNYSFCDKESLYMDVLDMLGTSLNQLGNICRSYDENQDYMTRSIRIYNQLRAFHRQVLGDPFEAVNHYRKLYENGSEDNKLFYGKQFITSLLYARTINIGNMRNRNNIVWAMQHLTSKERNDVQTVLQFQRNRNDLDSFENLFWFKMSSNEEFPLDEAVNLLIEWLHLYESQGKTGAGKLKALYYLAVCYSAMAINSDGYSEDYVKKAKKYFSLAQDLAESFEQSALSSYSYLGEEQDAHCILQPSQIDEAKEFEAVIYRIERRKGYVKLKCGLEAFFPANEFNSLADEGKTYLRGVIGFRYSGLGFYKFEKVQENSIEQLAEISDRLDEEYEERNTDIIQKENNKPKAQEKDKPTIKRLKKGEKYEGIVVSPNYGSRKKRIKCEEFPYPIDMEVSNNNDFYEDDIVIFTAGNKPHEKNKSKVRWYAYDIRLKEDE